MDKSLVSLRSTLETAGLDARASSTINSCPQFYDHLASGVSIVFWTYDLKILLLGAIHA